MASTHTLIVEPDDGRSLVLEALNAATIGIATTVPAEAAEVDAVFQADWSGNAVTSKATLLVWSPDNSRAKLTSLIAGIQKTLDIYCKAAEDPGTLEAMVAAAK